MPPITPNRNELYTLVDYSRDRLESIDKWIFHCPADKPIMRKELEADKKEIGERIKLWREELAKF